MGEFDKQRRNGANRTEFGGEVIVFKKLDCSSVREDLRIKRSQ